MVRSRMTRLLVGLVTLGGLACGAARLNEAKAADPKAERADQIRRLFGRENLIAWCIVPFDSQKRSPEARAEMLARLGFKHFAYDWRAEHVPTFDAEIAALKGRGVALDAFWASGELNADTRNILDVLKRNGVRSRLWVLLDFGADRVTGTEQERRVEAAVGKLAPLAAAAKEAGCSIALYNHGGWFGEPENQIVIVERLRAMGFADAGIVYNQHHGHDHLDGFAAKLAKLKPYLVTLNLNGMEPEGDKHDKKILPLGQGSLDLGLMQTIVDSGYAGPIGILGHTQDDAEQRLKDNLDGLDWLVPQLDGTPPGPRPKPRTYTPPPGQASTTTEQEAEVVAKLVAEAKEHGDAARGALVFMNARYGCQTCHKVGEVGGEVGPSLTTVGACLKPEQIAGAVLWPNREVKEGYAATVVATADGRVIQGYRREETATELVLRDAKTGVDVRLAKAEIEDLREVGSLMPDGLVAALPPDQRRDLIRFLLDQGKANDPRVAAMMKHGHGPAEFPYERAPIHPELRPDSTLPVNRGRLYDFYSKQAEFFAQQADRPPLLASFPGLDGGKDGHWGNQNEEAWKDGRWNDADLGRVLSGVFYGADGLTVPKGICVRLGEKGELAACFNPETLTYDSTWSGGFVKFSPTRHGFLGGLTLDGKSLSMPRGEKPQGPFTYRGFYRHGDRVLFSYKLGETEYLDAPWAEGGELKRVVGPAASHPLKALTAGGPARWPQVLTTKGELGKARPYAIDTIKPPFDNPWKAPLFFGDHDFLPDGTALITTMQGDVWHVSGLDDTLGEVRWRRFATGLHQPLGLIVVDGLAHVLGRDQITRLHDLNDDGEADFYECLSNAYFTSTSGHDFICGLQRDAAGRFYTASSKQGALRISADGRTVEVLATGFRNPDGIGLAADGSVTVPTSEGDWTPASAINLIRPGGHYGFGGPKEGRVPDLPLVYLPRGMDNSSGGQVSVPDDDRWGPLRNRMIHFSFGSGTAFLVLKDEVKGQPQGAVVPLPGEFRSGAHRGRFNPKDGQLYVSGMGGWGTYTPDDGSFQRVRYTGDPVQLPVDIRAHRNGIKLTFSRPLDASAAEDAPHQFAQAWNYRYSPNYGSLEYSPSHVGVQGHDTLSIRSATVLPDGRSLFLEIPELQPVNVLQLHLRVDRGDPIDLFATVHAMAPEFRDFPGYKPVDRPVAAHPILADLARLGKTTPNPWKPKIEGARSIEITAGKNLGYLPSTLTAKPGETLALTFINPDAVPHNWALLKPGTLRAVGDLVNKIISDPDAASRQYIPKTDDVLVYTDIVEPNERYRISFKAPETPGRYPFLCTFPGHWMVMNGELIVR
ncbi:plastocyanin/azurin family copper-binding protein [Isosphaeraceae bacterium EP7]